MRGAGAVLILGLLLSGPAAATQVKIFQAQSQGAFLAGTLDGVSVDTLGRVELAPRVERLAALDEPFLLSAAVHPDGWVVGTGNAGRVLKIDRKGNVSELFAAAEPEVFAVWADPDGTVFAGSSPGGKVYRLAPGARSPEVWFEPGETYIWSLARGAGGALLVATGTQGKLFQVDGKGKGRVLYDSDDTHVRSLAALPGGEVAVGTAGEGLVLKVGKDGRVRTLHDADQPEVVALAATPDGTTYAALVASEASLIDLSKPPTGQSEAPKGQGEPTVTVTVVEGGEPAGTGTGAPGAGGTGAMGSRKEGAGGPRSAVVRISPAGVVERVWDFNDDTIYALLWQGEALWAGTGLEGKLYRWDGTQMLLEKDVDERQVVALLPGEAGPAFATTNAAAFFRTTAGRERRGTYTSAPLDAGQAARFGSFRWRGETPGGSAVRLSFRSGVSAEPDATWSAWTEPREGQEISLEGLGLPRGRYVQWRAELLSGSSASPRLYGAELSYRQENLKPRIDGLLALEPGQILVPANFNPSNQVYEPAHPNREGIFSTVELSGAQEDARTKPLWKKGFRSLRWSASDPNGDQLLYTLSFRPEGTEHGWLQVAEDIKEDYYSFDATVLPDGVYRFRLAATDRESNVPEEAQGTEQVSDPVVIDHTPPVLGRVAREGKALRVELTDALSPLREAVYSVDAGEWRPARPADGLIDGQGETLLLEPAEGGKGGLLLLRVIDAAYNVVTFDLTQRR